MSVWALLLMAYLAVGLMLGVGVYRHGHRLETTPRRYLLFTVYVATVPLLWLPYLGFTWVIKIAEEAKRTGHRAIARSHLPGEGEGA